MQSENSTEPERLGLNSKRLEGAYRILQEAIDGKKIMGGAAKISKNGRSLEPRFYGRRMIAVDSPTAADTIFLTASLTKPVTSTAVMLLVERGVIRLDDTVSSFVPDFSDHGQKDRITVRHLLTHTSGLPDMVPEHKKLRAEHATLEDFLRSIYRTPLLFEPGTSFSYSSNGMGLLMDIVQRTTGSRLADFVRSEILDPLDMNDTSFGVNWNKADRVSQLNVPKGDFIFGGAEDADWNWNSKWWWNLGSPWGGMFSTVNDLTKFLNMFLNRGSLDGRQILSPDTARAMTTDQVETFLTIPDDVRHNNPWGFGWSMKMPFNAIFGDLVSSATFGHWGSTGTLVWADPQSSLICVVLTNQPFVEIGAVLGKFSNAVAGSRTIDT